MLFAANRTDPSHIDAFTPPGCRLRTAFCRVPVPEFTHGIIVSVFGIVPQSALSGTLLFGPLIVIKMFGQWLGDDIVASCQM
jgi:hypothetical protein